MNKEAIKKEAWLYARIIIGTVIFSLGFQYLLYPNRIMSGGIMGVSMMINLLTGAPVGVLQMIFNIPMFILAWSKLGRKFMVASLVSLVLCSVVIDLMSLVPFDITHDPLLACVCGGAVKGFGLGVIFSTGASGGGVDIVIKLLRRRYPHINLGTFVLLLDVAVIAVAAVVFGEYENALYAVISIFVVSKVIDFVLYGAATAKYCYIISDESDALRAAIVSRLGRGATMLRGAGAFSGQPKQVMLCVLRQRQIVELRRLVREIDSQAFMIVTDARQVYGRGFGNIYNDD